MRRRRRAGRPRLRKHRELREQLDGLLAATGRELDPDEMEVIDHFLASEGHVTAAELAEDVASEHPEVDGACVRGVLRVLERLGIARRVRTADREYYEHLHVGEHHDHMICTRCGRIEEFFDERIESRQLEQARLAGFQPLFHRLQMFGICGKCMSRREAVLPLSELAPGERGEVEELSGGRSARRRLGELGLTPGTTVEMLTSRGPILMLVRGSRVALGRGMARKVMVRRAGG
ncbi:MAG: transcriptional repressor [Planctomycetota bacterium]|jgi:Fur family ferric uptake transcriptional regulator